MFTAAALYRIDIAQLEIYQLILIGTALELAVFFFEVPTGIVADLKSRRLSIIIGVFIVGLGFIVEALTPYFALIFLAQIIWGFGYTFISGALQSWISDETDNINIEQTILTGSQFYSVMSFVGILLAALFGMIHIRIALYVAALLFLVLGVFNLFMMKEKHFQKTPHQETIIKTYIHQFTGGLRHIKGNHVLRIMFVIMLFFGLYSEGIDRTYELHILDNLDFRTTLNIPPIWILSIVNGLVALLGLILMQITKRYIKESHHVTMWLVIFTSLMVTGVLLFGFLPLPYFAVGGFFLFSITREATYPLLDTVLLKHTPSKIKATVLSTFGQLDAIGQIISGVIMVTIGVLISIKGIYLVTALLLLVPVFLLPLTNKTSR
jgi:DHA3 family tetracycline resistance protein-like MFS transporter